MFRIFRRWWGDVSELEGSVRNPSCGEEAWSVHLPRGDIPLTGKGSLVGCTPFQTSPSRRPSVYLCLKWDGNFSLSVCRDYEICKDSLSSWCIQLIQPSLKVCWWCWLAEMMDVWLDCENLLLSSVRFSQVWSNTTKLGGLHKTRTASGSGSGSGCCYNDGNHSSSCGCLMRPTV